MAPEPLDLRPDHLDEVRRLLARHLPESEVWAYGSRVTGKAEPASDLDLVVRNPCNLTERQTFAFWDLRDAFSESNLPFLVDLLDWAAIPESFRHEIEKSHVLVQQGVVENEQKVLTEALRNEEKRARYDSFTLVGQDREETAVEFALSAQREVAKSHD